MRKMKNIKELTNFQNNFFTNHVKPFKESNADYFIEKDHIIALALKAISALSLCFLNVYLFCDII